MILKDERCLKNFRGLRTCAWCGRWRQCDAAHLRRRGLGGGTRIDHPWNVCSLCSGMFGCHAAHHRDEQPLLCDLEAIVAAREGVLQGDLKRFWYACLAAPKGTPIDSILEGLAA